MSDNVVEITIRGVEDFEKTFKGALDGLDGIVKAAGVMSTAFVGAAVTAATSISILTERAISNAAEMGRMAQIAGETVEEFSKMAKAANLSEVNLETFSGGMDKLNKSMVEAADTGAGSAAKAFAAMGIELKNTDGTLKTNGQILLEVAGYFQQHADGANKSALAMAVFGRAGAQMIPMLNEGSAALQEMMDSTAGVTTEQAGMAREFERNEKILTGALAGIGNALSKEVLPYLVQLSDSLVDVTVKGGMFKDASDAITNGLARMAVIAAGVKFAFDAVYDVGREVIGEVFIAMNTAASVLIDTVGGLVNGIVVLVKGMWDIINIAGEVGTVLGKLSTGDFSGAWDAAGDAAIKYSDTVNKMGDELLSVFKKTGADIGEELYWGYEDGANLIEDTNKRLEDDAQRLTAFYNKLFDPTITPKTPEPVKPSASGMGDGDDTAQWMADLQKMDLLIKEMTANSLEGYAKLTAAEDVHYQKRLDDIAKLKESDTLATSQINDMEQAAEQEHTARLLQINQDYQDKLLKLSDSFTAKSTTNAYDLKVAQIQKEYDAGLANIQKETKNAEDFNALLAQLDKSREVQMEAIHQSGLQARAAMDVAANKGDIAGAIATMNTKQAMDLQDLNARKSLIADYEKYSNAAYLNIYTFASDMAKSFNSGLSSALEGLMQGTENLGQAVKALGEALLKGVEDYLANWISAKATQLVIAATFGTTMSATNSLLAATTAMAWSPAAALVSAATFGTNSTGAIAGLASTVAFSDAIAATSIAHGGLDYVPSESTFLLQQGERVVQPAQNVALGKMIADYNSGGGSGGDTVIHVHNHIGGKDVGTAVYRLSRNGQLTVHPRAVVAQSPT